jgi:UDP-2,3-diacylglucosamine hydrolase
MALQVTLPPGKKIYFASDFHLGAPDAELSLAREKKIIRWLESIQHDAHAIFFLGDIFDFWFEYRHTIPKGFIFFQGKLAELRSYGIAIFFFTGNHDLWMFDYFPTHLGIPVYREPLQVRVGNLTLLVGHGDGLGPGDRPYKLLKKIFASRTCQKIFEWLHPNIGMALATRWSRQSRIANMKREENFKGEEHEYLLTWCKEMEKTQHHHFYIFGHRHLVLRLAVAPSSIYLNLGEWVTSSHYAVCDGVDTQLICFEP